MSIDSTSNKLAPLAGGSFRFYVSTLIGRTKLSICCVGTCGEVAGGVVANG